MGVGTGYNLQYYPKDIELISIDWSSTMLEKAFERKNELGFKTLKLRQADCHNLPYEDETFDTVVDTFSLSSYYDHAKVL